MGKIATSLFVVIAIFFHSFPLLAYNYAEAEDPMVYVFRQAIAAAQSNNWSEVSRQVKEGIEIQKNHLFPGDHLLSDFKQAIDSKNIEKTAELFSNLVFLSILEKLHQNKKENFTDYKESKFRLQLAYKSYEDIFEGNIKKIDHGKNEEIEGQFKKALDSIGNPGLFGIGKTPPHMEEYSKAILSIEENIIKTFPYLKKQ